MIIPKLFIFDMDGLLLDSEAAFMETLKELNASYGYTLTRDIYEETLGLAYDATCRVMKQHFGEDYPYDSIAKEGRRLQNQKAAENGLPVKPGIPELLTQLQEAGIPACVASSSPRRTVEIYLSSSQLLPYFSYIASGDDIPRSKPDPEIFLLCCQRYGIAPENALVLEDSENGIRAALTGNIPVVCIPDMKQPAEALLQQTAATVPDAFALSELLFHPM